LGRAGQDLSTAIAVAKGEGEATAAQESPEIHPTTEAARVAGDEIIDVEFRVEES
jgi:hypothetical protein